MKQGIEDLALLGGEPAFAAPLHVGRPNIGDRDRFLALVNDLLDRRWLTNRGPFVEEFERRIAELSGTRHCIAMCNATVALEIAIRALEMTGEVIVPSFTFIATAHALQWQEITPVFCDIDPQTHNLDPGRIEALITPRTTGIIGVHLWGRPCAVEALEEIAGRRRLRLLFDAAHALGCTHRGRPVTSFGAAAVLSFHATKVLNTFEGGALVTDDDELASRVRLMKNFGFADYDRVVYLGTNGKLSEIAAAMGLASLESFEDFVAHNRRNYERYRRELADLSGIRLLAYGEEERRNYHFVVLEIDEPTTGVSRDLLLEMLWAENVLARRYFYPGCHRMEPYRSSFPHSAHRLPHTEAVAERVLALPTGTAVGEAEVATICGILRTALRNGREFSRSWRRRHGVAEPTA